MNHITNVAKTIASGVGSGEWRVLIMCHDMRLATYDGPLKERRKYFIRELKRTLEAILSDG